MSPDAGLNYCRDLLRDQDPDRYLLAALSPERYRPALMAVYAFNVEISRIRESVSESMLGEIRLQWWRDFIETLFSGAAHPHLIGDPLARAIAQYGLSKGHFERLIAARARDLETAAPETVEDLIDYAGEIAAPLNWLAFEVAGERSAGAAAVGWDLGVAGALNGLLRAVPHHLRQGFSRLPQDLMAEFGLNRDGLASESRLEDVKKIIKKISLLIDKNIKNYKNSPFHADDNLSPARLIADLTKIHQRRLASADFNPFDPKLATRPPFLAWRLVLRRMVKGAR